MTLSKSKNRQRMRVKRAELGCTPILPPGDIKLVQPKVLHRQVIVQRVDADGYPIYDD